MGETFGNPEELELVGGSEGLEMKAGPFAEVGGVAAEIDCNVPDVAGEDADELPLGLAELIMKPAEYASCGEGLVVLHESTGKSGGFEGILVENLGEPAAVIAKTSGLNKFDIEQRGIENLHPSSLSSETGRWKLLDTMPEMERMKSESDECFLWLMGIGLVNYPN